MKKKIRGLYVLLAAAVAFLPFAADARGAGLAIAKIYWEYNSSANDLGVHVSLDAEDWKSLKIVHPDGTTIFEVTSRGGWNELGMTELFFEGAEPSLDEFPLEELLELFPEGRYTIQAVTVDGRRLTSRPTFSHAIPAGPVVSSQVGGGTVVISWQDVTDTPEDFPEAQINIVGYQVLVGSFQVTLPGSANSLTLPAEFVQSLGSGAHPFEVLAIEASGNQTITESTFTLP